jgi:hypothetical protein
MPRDDSVGAECPPPGFRAVLRRYTRPNKGAPMSRSRSGLKWMLIAIALLVAAYLGGVAWMFTGKSVMEIDYHEQLYGHLRKIPKDQLAWPLYEKALEQIGEGPKIGEDEWALGASFNQLPRPGEKDWALIDTWVRGHAEALELIRRGAKLNHLGSIADRSRTGGGFMTSLPSYIELMPDDVSRVRQASEALRLEIYRAAMVGDGQRVIENVDAIFGIARQSYPKFLISDLVGLAITNTAFGAAGWVLAERPGRFTDEQLVKLAAVIRDADDLLRGNIEHERVYLTNVLQAMYTPGESGRVTWPGYLAMHGLNEDSSEWHHWLRYPVDAVRIAPKPEMMAEFDRVTAITTARLNEPMWTWSDETEKTYIARWTPAERLRWLPLTDIVVGRYRLIVEWSRTSRDALLVAIALEQHRRKHGAYPEALEALVPAFLEAVPPDRFTGDPLGYKLVDGRPLIYSRGGDRDDDAGRPTRAPMTAREWIAPAELAKRRASGNLADVDGDWILWPEPRDPPAAESPEFDAAVE